MQTTDYHHPAMRVANRRLFTNQLACPLVRPNPHMFLSIWAQSLTTIIVLPCVWQTTGFLPSKLRAL